MITVNNLFKKFGDFTALNGINLEVKRGEIYGFIGRNGAGKSTTMNILAGLSSPASGECLINGQNVIGLPPGSLNLGYLPEDPKFYPWLSARETLEYLADKKIKTGRIDQLLDWVGLKDAAKRRVGGYSRGMKQRLGICTALIRDPELVILDEPSSALDPEGRSDVLRLIGDLKQMGKTVFFSTHILSDVERICDTVGMIANGKMIFEKSLDEIKRENIVPVYDIVLKHRLTTEMTAKIAAVPGVREISASDEAFAATVEDTSTVPGSILSLLLNENQVIESFAQRQNRLEDIFIREVNGK